MEATPTVVLAMWAAGLAGGGALVVWWRVVGRGYLWLTSSVVALVGLALALTSHSAAAWAGTALGVGPARRISEGARLPAGHGPGVEGWLDLDEVQCDRLIGSERRITWPAWPRPGPLGNVSAQDSGELLGIDVAP